jgi:hypothetical protein
MAVDPANDTEKLSSLTDMSYQRIEEEIVMLRSNLAVPSRRRSCTLSNMGSD